MTVDLLAFAIKNLKPTQDIIFDDRGLPILVDREDS